MTDDTWRASAGRLALRILEAIYEEIDGWSDNLLAIARAVSFEADSRTEPSELLRELQRSGYPRVRRGADRQGHARRRARVSRETAELL